MSGISSLGIARFFFTNRFTNCASIQYIHNLMNLSPSHRGNRHIQFNFDESGNGNDSSDNNDKGQYNRRARRKVRDSVFGMKPMKSMGIKCGFNIR